MTARQVHKFPLLLTDEQIVMMPDGADPLFVEITANHRPAQEIMLWAVVWPGAEMKPRTVIIKGTGHDLPAGARADTHVGSVFDGPFVWHVFMKPQD